MKANYKAKATKVRKAEFFVVGDDKPGDPFRRAADLLDELFEKDKRIISIDAGEEFVDIVYADDIKYGV